jgi:hypothetical protein
MGRVKLSSIRHLYSGQRYLGLPKECVELPNSVSRRRRLSQRLPHGSYGVPAPVRGISDTKRGKLPTQIVGATVWDGWPVLWVSPKCVTGAYSLLTIRYAPTILRPAGNCSSAVQYARVDATPVLRRLYSDEARCCNPTVDAFSFAAESRCRRRDAVGRARGRDLLRADATAERDRENRVRSGNGRSTPYRNGHMAAGEAQRHVLRRRHGARRWTKPRGPPAARSVRPAPQRRHRAHRRARQGSKDQRTGVVNLLVRLQRPRSRYIRGAARAA